QEKFLDELSTVDGLDAKALVAIFRGRTSDARRTLTKFERLTLFGKSSQIASLYMYLGDHDGAFAYLERDLEERNGGFIVGRVDPLWDPIRSDPRFEALMHRVGLPSITTPKTIP